MNALFWFIVGGVTGWAACWYLGSAIMKHVIRHPEGKYTAEAIAGLPQESLLRFRSAVEAELEKRRTTS